MDLLRRRRSGSHYKSRAFRSKEPQEILVRFRQDSEDFHDALNISSTDGFAILCEKKHLYKDLVQVLLADLRACAFGLTRSPQTCALRLYGFDDSCNAVEVPTLTFRGPFSTIETTRFYLKSWSKMFCKELAMGNKEERLLAKLLDDPRAWEKPSAIRGPLDRDSDLWKSIRRWAMVSATSQPLQNLTAETSAKIREMITSEYEDLKDLAISYHFATRQSAMNQRPHTRRDRWPDPPGSTFADLIYSIEVEKLSLSLAEVEFALEETPACVANDFGEIPTYFTKIGRGIERLSRSSGEWVISCVSSITKGELTRTRDFSREDQTGYTELEPKTILYVEAGQRPVRVISPQIEVRIPLEEIKRLGGLSLSQLQDTQELREIVEVLNLRQESFAEIAKQGRPTAMIGAHKEFQFSGISLSGENLVLQGERSSFGTLKEAMREFEAEGYLSLDGEGRNPWELHISTMATQFQGLFENQEINGSLDVLKNRPLRPRTNSAEGIVADRLSRKTERIEKIWLRKEVLCYVEVLLQRRELQCSTLGLGRRDFNLDKILDKALRRSKTIALGIPPKMFVMSAIDG